MKHRAEAVAGGPILLDRSATGFGTWGKDNRAGGGAGTLILTEEVLIFDQVGSHLEIPVGVINHMAVGLWQQTPSRAIPVLKITYARNLVFGVAVAQPEMWIRAVDTLTVKNERRKKAPAIPFTPHDTKRFRLIVGGFLILVLVLTVALPVLFSWLSTRPAAEEPVGPERTGTAG